MELEKRTWVYVLKPSEYGISGCPCGDKEPQWSEFKKHLWCYNCGKDFIPESNGVFDGPILIGVCEAMGMTFDRFNLETQQIEKFDPNRK